MKAKMTHAMRMELANAVGVVCHRSEHLKLEEGGTPQAPVERPRRAIHAYG